MTPSPRIPALLVRLSQDNSGLALVEFALSLPIILMMGLGGVELAHMALTTERVNQIAMMTADNAARVRDSIDEVDVNEIMTGAKYVGNSINFAQNGRIILSSIQNNPPGTGQWVRWQRCTGAKNVTSSYALTEGKGQKDTSLPAVGPTGNQITAAGGTIVMFVEVTYDYQPIVPVNYFGSRTIQVTQAFNVRQRKPAADKDNKGVIMTTPAKDLLNGSSLPTSKTSDCSTFSA